MNYHKKYLKYKSKYLKLKQLIEVNMDDTSFDSFRIKLNEKEVDNSEIWCFDIDHTIKTSEDIEFILDKLKNKNWGIVTARWFPYSDKRLKKGSFFAFGKPNFSFTKMAKYKVKQISVLKEIYNSKKIYFFDNNKKNCFYVKENFDNKVSVYHIKKGEVKKKIIKVKNKEVTVKNAPDVISAIKDVLDNN